MDDETYCKTDFNQLPGVQIYVEKSGTTIDMNFKIMK